MNKDLLLIAPPFGSVEYQSLALHNLQSCSRKEGYKTDISYLNMDFANFIGDRYNHFCNMSYFLLGERLFARSAWGSLVPNYLNEDTLYTYKNYYKREDNPVSFFPPLDDVSIGELNLLEEKTYKWVMGLKEKLVALPYKYVGITTSFQQTNAAISILKIIKQLNPNIITFIGGFNCESEVAKGIESLDPNSQFLDYIFSGESEVTLIQFLNNLKNGIYPKHRIIECEPLKSLDELPNLDYTDYFTQLEKYLPKLYNDKSSLSLVMETSRGCWWGEKSQCKFCGTSDRIGFREKSVTRVLNELKAAEKWNINFISFADLIMPNSFLTTLMPILIQNEKKWQFYYEQKVSLNIDDLELIRNAGVLNIQPGVESLSNKILIKMAKGNTVNQNIQFLRDAGVTGFNIYWNIVWGIPGEKNSYYKRMNQIIPQITHLTPPMGLFHMTLAKFSPYYNNPEKYGIHNIKPLPSYYDIYPKFVDIDKIAMLFSCEYDCETLEDPTEIDSMIKLVGNWNNRWKSQLTRPRLHICKQGDGSIILLDTRGLENTEIKTELKPNIIKLLINNDKFINSEIQLWSLERSIAIVEDGFFIPLPTIDPEIRSLYENKSK